MRSTSAAEHTAELADRDAIRAVLDGDRDAFAILVRRHNSAVFRACRAILRDDADAEDALQVAWVKAYRALAAFRGESAFRTWVTRIAMREAAARARSGSELAAGDLPVTGPESPEHHAIVAQLGGILERAIDALPERLRTVLVLRDVLELDTAETAACVGIAEEAVRVRLHRARQALHRRFSEPDLALASVWQFDGERCARVQVRVLAAIDR